MAGDDRDPRGQGELGFLRAPRRRGRGAGPRDHRRARGAGRRRRGGAGRRRHAHRLPLRLLHGRAGGRGARVPAAAPAARRRRQPARRPRPRGVPRRVRADRRQRRLRRLRRRRRQELRPDAVQRRAGRPRPARRVVLPRREVRRDPREVRRLPDPDVRAGRAPGCGRRGSNGDGRRDPAVAGPLGARRDPRRPEDLQPPHPRGAARALPGLRLGGVHPQPGRLRGDDRRDLRPAAVLLRAPVDDPGGGADRGLARVARRPRRPRVRAVPRSGVRRDQLRLLRPHARWHAGAARALEARCRARRGLDRRGGRTRVRRPPLPAGLQGDDGRPRRQPAACLPPVDLGAGLDERRDQAGGVREARPVPLEDRLPREVP